MKFVLIVIAASIGSCLAGSSSQPDLPCTLKNLYDPSGVYIKSICYYTGQFLSYGDSKTECSSIGMILVDGQNAATLTALGTYVPELTVSDDRSFFARGIGADCYVIANNDPWSASGFSCSGNAEPMCEKVFPGIPNLF